MPTASSTPKSRIIGTFEIRSARNATTPVSMAAISGGARLASVSPIGMLVVVEQHLLLDPVVDLDREVDPEPDQDRQPGDRHEREVDADQAEEREAHSTPSSTASSGSSRQRTLKISHSTIAITATAIRPSRACRP